MKAQRLHSWTVTSAQAKRIQSDLATLVSTQWEVDQVRCVAGVDISTTRADTTGRAAVVALSFPELDPIDVQVIDQSLPFPYVPGLLSFREAPLIVSACARLEVEPDLVMVDGQGIAHPRRLGLASHLGLLWNRPTIGCAKSRLCGTHPEVPLQAGAYTELMDQGEVVGAALRTRHGVKPLYVSTGHKVDLAGAIEWVLRCCRGRRLPEPTRLAHLAAAGQLPSIKSGRGGRGMRASAPTT
jgi:deoxyribonuclease V